jgi:hypothetical protein
MLACRRVFDLGELQEWLDLRGAFLLDNSTWLKGKPQARNQCRNAQRYLRRSSKNYFIELQDSEIQES